jgi:hypothetical protein
VLQKTRSHRNFKFISNKTCTSVIKFVKTAKTQKREFIKSPVDLYSDIYIYICIESIVFQEDMMIIVN